MRDRQAPARHALAAALLVGAVAAGALALGAGGATAADEPTDEPTPTASSTEPTDSATPTATPTPTPTPTPTVTATPVTDATFRWGLSDESSNRAYAPDTVNLFSAGVYPDPGRGGVTIRQDQWQQQVGHVSVEKWDGTAYRPATWAGLGTDASGTPLGTPSAGTFSGHTFVFDGGTGTADPATDSADIAWDGDVSVLYYSGMSYFVLSDPVLHVDHGAGAVTATLSGYASSQSDTSVWAPVPARSVTVATLTGVDVGDSFTTTPAYAGVGVTGVPQVRTGAAWGSFPQSYVDYLDQLGSAAFWYSSGGTADPFKVALPITVALDAGAEVVPAVPVATASKTPKAHNQAEPAPSTTPTASTTPTSAATPVAAPPVAQAAPPAAAPAAAAATPASYAVLARPETQLRLTSATTPAAVRDRAAWPWWSGGGCLLLAALGLLAPGRSGARAAPPA